MRISKAEKLISSEFISQRGRIVPFCQFLDEPEVDSRRDDDDHSQDEMRFSSSQKIISQYPMGLACGVNRIGK